VIRGRKVCRVTAIVRKGLTKSLVPHLTSAGIVNFSISSARTIILHEKRKGLGMVNPFKLVEDQADIIVFLVGLAQEEQALDLVIDHGELMLPGRGTVYSEEVTLIESPEWSQENEISSSPDPTVKKQSSLAGLCCVVQRGQANPVARVALDMGASVPAVSFGIGTGIREKLGLLRIAIPAEKEIIHLAVSTYDADPLMKMMITAGNLDQPGKGFIFTYPIHKGLIDTKITHGITRHVASVEQIIATLDEIKGDIGWRRRSGRETLLLDEEHLLSGLIDLTVICNEGRGRDLIKEGMRAGARGATIISKIKNHVSPDLKPKALSPAREACSMAVREDQRDGIVEALLGAGLFDEKTSGQILVRSIPKAFTYARMR